MTTVLFGDAEEQAASLPAESIDCCITSPPYFRLRDYGVDGQIGLENTPEEYIDRLVNVFREVRRALKKDGTLWVVIGDCYAGSGKGAVSHPDNAKNTSKGLVGAKATIQKQKYDGIKPQDLIGIPWMLAFALRADGWWLRQDIIWHKPNIMPESVKSRCTKSHEYVFMFAKSHKYYYDYKAIREPAHYDGRTEVRNRGALKYSDPNIRIGKPNSIALSGKPHERWIFNEDGVAVRNRRSVWKIPTRPFKGAHFATFPPDLVTPMILAGCREGGTVLDPFCGSGTTLEVAQKLGRNAIGIELNENYRSLIVERIGSEQYTGEVG